MSARPSYGDATATDDDGACAEILSVGMVTAIGGGIGQTAASARAGIARFSESYIDDQDGEPIVLGLVGEDNLPPLCDALADQEFPLHRGRLLRLAGPAVLEAAAAVQKPLPVMLGIPDPRPDGSERSDAQFLSEIAVQTGCDIDLRRSVLVTGGRTAGMRALKDGIARVQAGELSFLLAGAVDSYLDPPVLEALDEEQRIRRASGGDGFIPGEAAAFLLLGAPGLSAQIGVRPLARVVAVGSGVESGHMYSDAPYRGDGLAQAFAAVLGAVPGGGRVKTVYAGLNGEGIWAKELGVARVRSRQYFHEPVVVEHPADTCGDTGAAFGPMLVGLAAWALHRGAREGLVLVYCGSDRGERIAILLDRADEGAG